MTIRNVVVLLEVDDDLAIEQDVGTVAYVEQAMKDLSTKGITIANARVIDDDDPEDEDCFRALESIF